MSPSSYEVFLQFNVDCETTGIVFTNFEHVLTFVRKNPDSLELRLPSPNSLAN